MSDTYSGTVESGDASRPPVELQEGAILEGSHWPESVRVISAKQRASRIEIHAIGVHSRRHFAKLLSLDEFAKTVRVSAPSDHAAFDGDPTRFRLAAEAHRIRLAHQYDPHFAVSVSQVDPLPHQLDAVYSRMLTQPQIRLLIADDPGAGKTIMGGLLIKELKLRGLIDRILIVTPANLTDQWRRELNDKFGESFAVINRAAVNATYGRNVWEDSAQCITSIDFVARQDDVQQMMHDIRWDLVIVDEAHKMAAYRYGTKIDKTARYEFGEFLRNHTDHLLFLTATPHKGDPDNFALLLQLLDRDLFASGEVLAEAGRADENRIMIRRLKEDMKTFDGRPCFPPRHVRTLPYHLSREESDLYEAVTDYVKDNFQRAESEGNRNVGLALTVLQRRLASSITAVTLSLERRLKRLRDLRKLGKLKQEFGELPEDLEDLAESDRWRFEDEVVERLTLAANMAELETEIAELDELVRKARHARRNVTETKFEELRSVISEHVSGKTERLLVFTEHKDTLDFLLGKLTDLGFYCCSIHGGMPLQKRIDAERDFYEHNPSIMVATEAAGEGINLQFCSLMVNYDLPWNPNRLEQRMGRIHRYKQQKEVMVFNLVAANTREGEVMHRVLVKLEAMRKALGSDRVYDVIGEIIDTPQFERLMRDWLANRRTIQEILAEIDLITDERQVDRIRTDMQNKALGSRYIDMSLLSDQLRQSKEERLMPEYIEQFFIEAYRSFGGTIVAIREQPGVWSISRVPAALRRLPERMERRFGRVGQTYPRLTFDKDRTGDYEDVEFVGPGHPLFECVVERVLQEYGPALLRGATFYNADASEPEVLWLIKCGIEDGQSRPIAQRLFAVHNRGGVFRRIQPYALLDLKAPDDRPTVPPALREPAEDEDSVIDWSLDAVVGPYFSETRERRNRELAIKEKYVRKSLNHLIAESNRKMMDYDRKLGEFLNENDAKALNIKGNRAQEMARRDELVHRRDARLAELEHEKHLAEQPPEIIGVAVVLPVPTEAPAAPDGSMKSDPEVEAIAVEVAKRYERDHGRKPVSVEEENCGWDITSLEDGEVSRYIEVKGRAQTGAIALTPNEWIKAQRFSRDYWLYVVDQCRSEPSLHLIRDPASKLEPKEEISVVRYVVQRSEWQTASTEEET
jgi:superfamily II DNA or RNA helicase